LIEVVNARNVDTVKIEVELEAVCPITKTVDHYKLVLTYIPNNGRYIEFVSFKKYLETFKGREILHEELANTIAEEVCKAAKPKKVTVELQSKFMEMNITVTKELSCSD
jgi:NADPH-dependent 7-cyano-7-deazaguanine reductase QueF